MPPAVPPPGAAPLRSRYGVSHRLRPCLRRHFHQPCLPLLILNRHYPHRPTPHQQSYVRQLPSLLPLLNVLRYPHTRQRRYPFLSLPHQGGENATIPASVHIVAMSAQRSASPADLCSTRARLYCRWRQIPMAGSTAFGIQCWQKSERCSFPSVVSIWIWLFVRPTGSHFAPRRAQGS